MEYTCAVFSQEHLALRHCTQDMDICIVHLVMCGGAPLPCLWEEACFCFLKQKSLGWRLLWPSYDFSLHHDLGSAAFLYFPTESPTPWKRSLMLGKIESRRRRGWQRMRWLDGITDLTDMSSCKLRETGKPSILQSPWVDSHYKAIILQLKINKIF